jgi:MSHA pilin protein MshC
MEGDELMCTDSATARLSAGRPRLRALSSRGFTLVELITVILLLSIVGVFAMARMASPGMFAPAVVSQALVAELRFAQQLATARRDAVVSVAVDRVGDDWRFRTLTDVDGVLRTERVGRDGTAVQAVSGAASAALDAATALTVSFDHAGDLDAVSIGGAAGTPASGVSLTVSGDSTRQVCIYPSGYTNADACS